ncbi:hypothetical protein BDN72DRAFT_860006 [Pluteus cervinus]|uniref:Uncharacterized protein n=1 Tax=Pluteus cervinus TaxID=181527 RepID=A0ACD3AK84_9AGAR|nr:hypothetical protein BDN72DRAFT_860006 [Pluteus cervinus]
MDRISQNKEILHHIIYDILNFGIFRRRKACLFVCKSWFDVAQDILWRKIHMRDFCRLFKILCPMKKVEKSAGGIILYKFRRDVTAADWTRFERYSRRIRVLKLELEPSTPVGGARRMDQSVYDALAVSRPASGVFPNLTELRIDSRFSYCAPLFLSPGVKILKIGLHYPKFEDEPEYPLNDRADLLHHASLQITSLLELSLFVPPAQRGDDYWDTGYTICQEEESICQLLRRQSQLHSLSLPYCWFTSCIAEAAAFLPDLKSISPVRQGPAIGNPLDTLSFNPLLGPRISPPFPSIQELYLAVPYPQFQRFLLQWIPSGRAHTKIQVLTIRSQVLESPQTIQGMLETLVPRCPNLTSLHISSLCSPEQMPWTNSPAYERYRGGQDDTMRRSPSDWTLDFLNPFRVTLDAIRALFSLDYLRNLDLHHHLPAAFSTADIETIALNLSHLKNLDLFSDPHPIYLGGSHEDPSNPARYDETVMDQTGYKVKQIPGFRHTLRAFGSKCPNLQTLGIFVCPSPTDLTPVAEFLGIRDSNTTSHSTPVKYFPNLKEPSFGSSYCRDTMSTSLAFALGEYLDTNARISTKLSWAPVVDEEDDSYFGGAEDSEYGERLKRGGRIPPAVDQSTNPQVRGEAKPYLHLGRYCDAWNFAANGDPIPSDEAIFTSAPGDPLIFDLTTFSEDTAMHGTMGGITTTSDGERWMPGVGLCFEGGVNIGGGLSQETKTELTARRVGWRAMADAISLMRTIRLQEDQLVERRIGTTESGQESLEGDFI